MLTYPLFLGSLGFWEIFLIVLVIVLIWGGKKIPELMRGVGKGVKSFRQGMNEIEDEFKEVTKDLDKDSSKKADEQ
ncbi:MAG: twin-arginine translocase TatA/TatE family subunit [Bacteroidales bacterium]|jgi:sec-independent protein translocase protein TatA|nr:twin-arginine translocase TatA/TatE family subunit [Bacteroidales bacterium]MBR5054966.1 twin-arginine translocase TatA/TatE family subunit [Bacteroidales bacterium]